MEQRRVRTEVEALRALAVTLVVAFHLWPDRIPGGYVGVDVFFVISGFLITSHLLGEVARTGSVSLTRFWARRVRRLLPAAFTVLIATLLATLVWLPRTMWKQTFQEVAASALYVQNWLLAGNSVDYLAAENDPSPVQHYWSLSVEEQFYIIWPVLIAMALLIGKRPKAVLVALLAVFAVSLVFSIFETLRSQPSAYFITPTRAWEFTAGALLAYVPAGRFSPRLRAIASWAGIAAIAIAAFAYTGSTPFPGFLAMTPVIGAAMVIWAGQVPVWWSPTSIGDFRPIQGTGALSYSIYLWHWPLIVLYPHVIGTEPGLIGKTLIIAATILLALLTKTFVEDPVRFRRGWITRRRVAYGFAASGMFLVAGTASLGVAWIQSSGSEAANAADELRGCIGAHALYSDARCEKLLKGVALLPSLEARADDTEDQYTCYVNPEAGVAYRECVYGDPRAEVRIAVTGDSHAASLLPGVLRAAEEHNWSVTPLVGRDCQLGDDDCGTREEFDRKLLSGDFDLVLVAGVPQSHPDSTDLVSAWRRFVEAGVPLVPVVGVPTFPEATEQCLAASAGELQLASRCVTPRNVGLASHPDQYGPAARTLGLSSVDLTQVLCDTDGCPAVIGHVIVYRDHLSHLTSTFSDSLDEELGARISRLLR